MSTNETDAMISRLREWCEDQATVEVEEISQHTLELLDQSDTLLHRAVSQYEKHQVA